MKKILVILLLLPVLAFAEEVKLLTWNVFMLPRPINFSRQKERTALIGKALLETDYDIILLQEAFVGRFRKDVSRIIGHKYPYQDHLAKSRRLLHFLNSGLYIASRYPFEVLGWHYFNECTNIDCLSSKGVLLVEVTTPKGKKVQIAMSHMQAWDDKKAVETRKNQIEEIKTLLDTYSRPNVPQILAGDLNIDGKVDLEYPAALATLQMISTSLKGPILASNGFKVDCYKTPGGHSDGQWLDHFWLRAQGTESVIFDKKVRPFFAVMKGDKECSLSDHYAVEATLKL